MRALGWRLLLALAGAAGFLSAWLVVLAFLFAVQAILLAL